MKIENSKSIDNKAQDKKSSCVFARAFNSNVIHSNFYMLNYFAGIIKTAKDEIALIFKQMMKKASAKAHMLSKSMCEIARAIAKKAKSTCEFVGSYIRTILLLNIKSFFLTEKTVKNFSIFYFGAILNSTSSFGCNLYSGIDKQFGTASAKVEEMYSAIKIKNYFWVARHE